MLSLAMAPLRSALWTTSLGKMPSLTTASPCGSVGPFVLLRPLMPLAAHVAYGACCAAMLAACHDPPLLLATYPGESG